MRSTAASRPHEVDVVVCSLPELNLLNQIPPELFQVRWVDVAPLFVPFACREVLAQGLGDYDWFCYIEDDLVFHDPLFFDKLRWFQDATGPDYVLQPNRYEVAPTAIPRKVYIDGPVHTGSTAAWQDLADTPELHLIALGFDIRVIRSSNPHAASYFLTSDQMAMWVRRPSFSDRDCSFVGPLESAASLGLMQEFRVYKPSPEDASFLEVEHLDTAWARRGMGELPWPE